jgi:GAF domain-containing protein
VLADVSRSLATFLDLDQLVHYATRRTRELFDAEGCALLLLDRDRQEFYFPVASQRELGASSEAQLADVRFPANQGIAGWVLANDEGASVADVATDTRFYEGVDRRTAMHTRSLLCAPLRTREGNIGVIEVVNPAADRLGPGDLEFLDILASVIGVAYEKAALYNEVEREALDLRRFCRMAGWGLTVLAVLLGGAAAFYHRARVLPWSEFPSHRGVLLALLCLVLGMVLVGVGSGRIVSAPAGRARPR